MSYPLFNKFIAACRDYPEKVQVKPDATDSASDNYKLHTKKELLGFIGNHGLVDLVDGIEEEWRLNPDPDKENNPQYVNDYLCKVKRLGCYLAIIDINYWYREDNDKWILKSFKPPDPDKMNRFLPAPFQLSEYNWTPEG